MFLKKWMSYISDDALITKLAIVGAHNAGSYGMKKMACCQKDDLYEQFCYGVRHYCIRLDTDKNGVIRMAHSISKGDTLENGLIALRKAIDENDSEFFIFDVRKYYPMNLGLFRITFQADATKVDPLIEKYLEPEKYAFVDFDDISKVTMGDLRKSGKRYILYNYEAQYKYSVDCPYVFPFDKKIHGSLPQSFVEDSLSFIDKTDTDGFFWYQIQQTPNIGTKQGLKSPRILENNLKPYFANLFNSLYDNSEYVRKLNIISGDFMTDSTYKAKRILKLNLLKNVVDFYKINEYTSFIEE